jgi:hypothetical protein
VIPKTPGLSSPLSGCALFHRGTSEQRIGNHNKLSAAEHTSLSCDDQHQLFVIFAIVEDGVSDSHFSCQTLNLKNVTRFAA